jgi:hypothetical protein
MRRVIETGVSKVSLGLFVAIAVVSLAPGCDSQGVPFQPPDTTAADTTGADGVTEDSAGPADVAPGWDWWSGDLLAWRAEQIPLQEVFHDIDGVANATGYEIYAVGFRGAVLRLDSSVGTWQDVSPSTALSIEGVWAAGPKSAWVCGEKGLLMRYEAPPGATYAEWTDETDPLRPANLNGIHGSGPDDVWAVGEAGTVLRNQGNGWTQIPHADLQIPIEGANDLYAVYARSPDDVWVAGQGMMIWWNGVEWDQRSVDKGDGYISVGGTGDHIWIGSDGGYLWYFNGEFWKKIAAPIYYDYNAVWADTDGTAYATGEDPSPQSIIWIGKKEPWDQLEVSSPEGVAEQWVVQENSLITGLWGAGPEDLFACTLQQQILRYSTHE